jgi:hypothetical protein|tara:strand:+ start:809 stop:1057 length:249 start_codon:yes stop_codon:yes gene_type:complete
MSRPESSLKWSIGSGVPGRRLSFFDTESRYRRYPNPILSGFEETEFDMIELPKSCGTIPHVFRAKGAFKKHRLTGANAPKLL